MVRVVNFGESDILIDHYDERVPLGFLVSNGELLRVELLEASNRYLSSNLRVSVADSVRGVFTPIILESKEFFAFKALILHAHSTPPTLSPWGKIAGVRTINLTEQSSTESEKSYWHTVFAGGVWVQAARADCIFLWAYPFVNCCHFSSSLCFGKTHADKTHKAQKTLQKSDRH